MYRIKHSFKNVSPKANMSDVPVVAAYKEWARRKQLNKEKAWAICEQASKDKITIAEAKLKALESAKK